MIFRGAFIFFDSLLVSLSQASYMDNEACLIFTFVIGNFMNTVAYPKQGIVWNS